MISRVAVLPQPPLLVPELMGASVAGSEPMRAACLDAAARLAEASRDWVVLAPAAADGSHDPASSGSFRGYGADVEVSLRSDMSTGGPSTREATCRHMPRRAAAIEDLPLPALLAGWLREKADASTVRVQLLAEGSSGASCARVAQRLAATAPETALLVLGDGSNRRGAKAPGGHDDRADGFDAVVSGALRSADSGALRDLDPVLAAELGVSGRAPWQVLAALANGDWRAELLYSGAPFGVGYHVAVWDRA